MAISDTNEPPFGVDDDCLFHFTLAGEIDDKKPSSIFNGASISSSCSYSVSSSVESSTAALRNGGRSEPSPEVGEEELEWILNKDAFPGLETCFGILSENLDLLSNHQSPMSVLENSNSSSSSGTNTKGNDNSDGNGVTVATYCRLSKVPTNFPVCARSKRPRSKRKAGFGEYFPSSQHSLPNKQRRGNKLAPMPTLSRGVSIGRSCTHCQAEMTPQWRAGPMGPKTLCNACGLRYMSGRLLPEYRPAGSPTFLSTVHSNSHRKVIEIRKQKHLPAGEGTATNETADTNVCQDSGE